MRLTSVVPHSDRTTALGPTTVRRNAATAYAAASLALFAAIVVAASAPDVRLHMPTLGTIAAYPLLLGVTIALARPRGAERSGLELALLHAGTLLVGSVGLAVGVGLERLGWLIPAGIVLVGPVVAGLVAAFAGPATGFVVARQARRGFAYLAATLWFPVWIVREILLQR